MTRTRLPASLLALLFSSTAAASPAAEPEPASYRSVTITTDALWLASAFGGTLQQSRGDGAPLQPWFTASAVGSILATPILHGVMGHRERSPGSFGLRLGLAIAGGYAAYRLSEGCEGWFCERDNVDYGVLAGLAAASVLDAVWISSEAERAEPRRVITPQLAAGRDGATVGLGGTF